MPRHPHRTRRGAGSTQMSSGWRDVAGDDPPVLADLAVASEPEVLIGRERPVEEEAGRHREGILWVTLDGPPAQAGDQIERSGERGSRDALPAVAPADIAAGDPPVRW